MAYEINLLSWRDEKRLKYKQRFIAILVLAVILSVCLQWGFARYLNHQASLQDSRNNSLTTHVTWLNSELKGLAEIGKQHEAILTRLKVVENLQQNRNKTTQILNLLPEVITEGVYLNKIRMDARSIEMKGFSDSNARLATMLDKLERSTQIVDVEMHSIVSGQTMFGHEMSRFDVSFRLLAPKKRGNND
ncbi:PilN domain-containing protein [Aliivibrio sp. SR45-2]|uniref:PilN domain-containing protein n=1 Tax=Aliivibrio sp. SR45-2 TaxID=2760931 RepID=UPI0015FAE085|nr:PilN domain-containing protein [Aliivibrio sp. SR45-2]MBB1312276.1 PilN domain-containing protein [Aliivibrio sp. SR45-2]